MLGAVIVDGDHVDRGLLGDRAPARFARSQERAHVAVDVLDEGRRPWTAGNAAVVQSDARDAPTFCVSSAKVVGLGSNEWISQPGKSFLPLDGLPDVGADIEDDRRIRANQSLHVHEVILADGVRVGRLAFRTVARHLDAERVGQFSVPSRWTYFMASSSC